jgi:hypothetical protein
MAHHTDTENIGAAGIKQLQHEILLLEDDDGKHRMSEAKCWLG